MGSFAPFFAPPRCDGGQLGRSEHFCVVSGFPAVRHVTVIRALGAMDLSRDEAAYRSASYLGTRLGVVALLLRLYVRTPISALIEVSIFFSDAAYVDSKAGYSYYEISFAKTTATAPAHDSSQDQSPCAPQIHIPLFDTFKAEKVETGFTRDLSEQRPQSNASLLKPQTNSINEAPSILSRKRPIPRLSFEIPRFSSRLDDDTTLDDDRIATLL